jgi:transglutaminase-like putative cysteine protease
MDYFCSECREVSITTGMTKRKLNNNSQNSSDIWSTISVPQSEIRFWIICFLLIILVHNVKAELSYNQTSGYRRADIPDSLISNANVVIRESKTYFTYESPKQTTYKYRRVITIMNGAGDKYSELSLVYDQFTKISFKKGNIYNAEGILIKKIKSSDIKDFSYLSESSLYEDYRIMYYQPLISSYPYTVEYEYEKSISGSFAFPRWNPVEGYNVALQESDLIVSVPKSYLLRYIENNLPGKGVVTTEGRNNLYKWKILNFRARDYEEFSPIPEKVFPNVLTAPSEFSLGGYPGSLESWERFGQWLYHLNEGRDRLPQSTIDRVRALVKGMNTDKDKIKAIYKYLQSKTRYVSIQLGIGGWQTIEASIVDDVGYGDCKALSNYAVALLKAVGIKAYYALVNGGPGFSEIREDFPSNQFNHEIVCVPLKSDTIWLECTSQIDPIDFLGDFTSNRKVLLIKENGGELVRTKVYSLTDNLLITKARIILKYNGNAHAWTTKKYGGQQLSDVIGYVHSNIEEQKKWLFKQIDIPNYQLLNYSLTADSSDNEEATVKAELDLENYAAVSGKRLFIPLNILSHSEYMPPKTKDRKQSIVINRSVLNIDTIEYRLPSDVSLEYIPEPVSMQSDFGNYSSSTSIYNGTVYYIRKFVFYSGIYAASKYGAFLKFFHDISNIDKNKLVLVKTGY